MKGKTVVLGVQLAGAAEIGEREKWAATTPMVVGEGENHIGVILMMYGEICGEFRMITRTA